MKRFLAILAVLAIGFSAVAGDKKADEEKALKLTDGEQLLVDLTNAERVKNKVPKVKVNPLVMKAARGHSANMAAQGKREHKLDGKGADNRLDDIGYKRGWWGENIYSGENPKEAFKWWMNSKGHRETILDKKFIEIGVGMVRDPKKPKLWYFTLVFASPKE